MITQHIEINNKLGLHARAAAKLVTTANKYASSIRLNFAGNTADAKSIMSIMMLAAAKGSIVEIIADGQDAQDAINDIVTLIDGYFGEDE